MPAKSHRSPAAASQCPSLHLRLPAHTPATAHPCPQESLASSCSFLNSILSPARGLFPNHSFLRRALHSVRRLGLGLNVASSKSGSPIAASKVLSRTPHTHHLLLSCIAFIATRYLAYLFYSPSPDLRMSVPCEEGPRACSPLLHPRHPEHGADPAHAQRVFVASASEDSAGERSREGTGRPWVKGQGLSASEPPASRPRVSPCGPLRELQSPPWFLLRLIECN